MSITPLFKRPSRIILVAAVLAAAFTGAAFWWQKAAQDTAPLIAALDAFTGDWKGEATIEGANGTTLAKLTVTRRYSWVGERQIVETRFHAEAEGYATRTMQWVENGRLRAVVTGPEGMPHNFVGARTAEGILWTNLERPDSDCLERLVVRAGKTSMQTASFTNVRLGNISGLVGVAAIFERQQSPGFTPEAEKLQKVVSRVDELERSLAVVVKERAELREMLARAEQARTAVATNGAGSAAGETARSNRLEINSSPSGLGFELHVIGEHGQPATRTVLTGMTPVRLEALPVGDYTVTIHSASSPDVIHHVALREVGDVVLYHRQQSRPAGATPTTPEATPAPAPVAPSAAPASEGSEQQIARIGELDQAPKPVRTVLPRLEGMRKYAGQNVNVSVLVDEKGMPRDVTVPDIDDERLVELCSDAVSKWRFNPGMMDGRPVAVRVTVPFALR